MGSLISFRFSEKSPLGAPGKVSEGKSVYIELNLAWGRTLDVDAFVYVEVQSFAVVRALCVLLRSD